MITESLLAKCEPIAQHILDKLENSPSTILSPSIDPDIVKRIILNVLLKELKEN